MKSLVELKATKNQDLASTIQAIKDANKNNDHGCYPAAASITVFSPPFLAGGLPKTAIGDARTAALTDYFTGKGLAPKTDFDISSILGQDDKTQVQFNGVDRDPPIIRTNSNPLKGTKVKAGQKIAVHSTVRDSNKSWPTGVKSIQLIANGLLEEPAEDYGMKPPPCQVRTFERTYTVPANPPPVVKLRVYAEDAVGLGTFEEADFPTGDWYGTLRGHGQGSQYNETAVVEFSFSEKDRGTIEGSGHVTVTSEPQVSGDCVSQNTPPDPFDVSISGRHVGDEFQLELANPRKTIKMSSKCRSGSNTFSRSTSGFLGAGSQSFLQPKVAAKDGASNVLPQTPGFWPVDAKIELHQARKN